MRPITFRRITIWSIALAGFIGSATVLSAQSMLIGGKAGVPLNDPFVLTNSDTALNGYTFANKRYTVGPFFLLNLPYKLSFEADALYKRLHYESNPFLFVTPHATTTGDSWEFPFTLSRSFSFHSLHPYAGGGFSLRHVGGRTVYSNSLLASRDVPEELADAWSPGGVVSGGVDLSAFGIHFRPEVRYTRWGKQNFQSANGVFNSNQNSIDFLVGVGFSR